jgi:hypothetical protein
MKTLNNLKIHPKMQTVLLNDETHHKIVQYTLRKIYKVYKEMGEKDDRIDNTYLKDLMYRNNANEEEMYIYILCMLNTMELFVKSLGFYHQKALVKLLGHKCW